MQNVEWRFDVCCRSPNKVHIEYPKYLLSEEILLISTYVVSMSRWTIKLFYMGFTDEHYAHFKPVFITLTRFNLNVMPIQLTCFDMVCSYIRPIYNTAMKRCAKSYQQCRYYTVEFLISYNFNVKIAAVILLNSTVAHGPTVFYVYLFTLFILERNKIVMLCFRTNYHYRNIIRVI